MTALIAEDYAVTSSPFAALSKEDCSAEFFDVKRTTITPTTSTRTSQKQIRDKNGNDFGGASMDDPNHLTGWQTAPDEEEEEQEEEEKGKRE